MSPTAIIFLVIAVVVVWGGLAASIWRLRRDTAAEPDLGDDVPPGEVPHGRTEGPDGGR